MSSWTTDDVEFMDEGELKEALATLGVTVAGNESVDELRQKALEALPKEELKKPSDPKSTAPSVAEVDAMKAQLQQSGQELPAPRRRRTRRRPHSSGPRTTSSSWATTS